MWEPVKIKDIVSGFYDGPHATPEETSQGPIFLGVKNITPEGRLDLSENKHLSDSDFVKWTKRVLPRENDIVFTYEATLHRYAIIPKDIKCCLGRRLALLRINEKVADYKFVYYWLLGDVWRSQVESKIITGATVDRIPLIEFPDFVVPLPPLPLQRQIAAVLGRYDALLENYQAQVAALEGLAQELYREWFVRGRCPDAEAGPNGELPAGWKVKKVADCFDITGGGTPSREEPNFWEEGTVNWYTPTDITGGNSIFLTESSEKITKQGLNSSSARLFPAYSAMMTSRATIGAVAINTEPASTNQGFIVCLPNERFSFAFIYFWLLHNRATFEMLANGATFLEISKGNFKKIDIIVPGDEQLRAFDAVALPIFKKIENLQAQITALHATRDALLPRLLSGQLLPSTIPTIA